MRCEDTMLIEFKVENFRSYKDIVTFSMVASHDKDFLDNNTITVSEKMRLLKTSVIYGANASGKSNLFKAIAFMKNFVLNSSRESQANEPIEIDRFRLSTATDKEPTTFEAIFLIDNTEHRYGFQVYDNKIQNEWLFHKPSIREATLFTREEGVFTLGKDFKEGKGKETLTRDNALFLSVVAQFNGEKAKKIIKWFDNIKIISGVEDEKYMGFTVSHMDEPEFMEFSKKFLKIADLGIKDIQKIAIPLDRSYFPKEFPGKLIRKFLTGDDKKFLVEIKTIHQKFDENNEPLSDEYFYLSQNESAGTLVFFGLSAFFYDTLKNGRLLIIDEFTAQLHPWLTRAVIEIFHDYKPPQDNPLQSKAQFIFTAHDASLMTNQIFRRDQIWFTEKDEYGATDLYSLEEYKIRKDASFKKDYLMGRYGGVPYINQYIPLFK